MANNEWYGWKKQPVDDRDYQYKVEKAVVKTLADTYDLRKLMPPVYDQQSLGSCTANGSGAAFQYEQRKQKVLVFRPSRLYIYYNTRLIEGSVNEDSGGYIRDAVKSIAKYGVCTETRWPYKIDQFTVKPPSQCYGEGSHHKAVVYRSVMRKMSQIQGAIAGGYPVIFGFTVYESFEGDKIAKTGIMSMPKRGEQIVGGHCVLAVGYDRIKKVVTCRNSWGNDWGDKGYFYMPEAYFADPDLSNDFWIIEQVTA